MYELALILAGLAAGYLLRSWMQSRTTGQPLADVLRGNPGEERKEAQRGNPGEE